MAPMANTTSRRVGILGGNRIPFARSDGAYANASNQDMFTAALGGLIDRFDLAGEKLGAVIGGAVLKHSRDFNLMRECVLGSSLSSYTPAFDIQQACGTGLQATIAAADGVAAGRYEVAAAGGVDTASDAPIAFGDDLRRVLLGLRRSKSNVDRLKLVGKLPASLGVEIPVNSEPRTGMSMGEHAAITAKQMGIKRVDQDELAAASHNNMAAAYDRGFFDDLVTPFLGLYRDNNLRADSSADKLAKLKPVFGVKSGDATMTAGNSRPAIRAAGGAWLRVYVLLFAEADIERIFEAVPVATHNQRGLGTLHVGCPEGCDTDIDGEQLLAIVENSMSSEIYELMKRSDEGAVVEKAHRRPRFVEDCVREMISGVVEGLPELSDDAFVSARQENLETIHQHNVVADRHGMLGELRRELASGEHSDKHVSMRDWLEGRT